MQQKEIRKVANIYTETLTILQLLQNQITKPLKAPIVVFFLIPTIFITMNRKKTTFKVISFEKQRKQSKTADMQLQNKCHDWTIAYVQRTAAVNDIST